MATLVRKSSSKDVDAGHIANARRIATLADEKKAKDIKAFEVTELTVMTDAFVICTATSEPQMKAVMNNVRKGMREVGVRTVHLEGDASSGWILLDFGTVLCHIFREEARSFYDLEDMWADAPKIELDLEE